MVNRIAVCNMRIQYLHSMKLTQKLKGLISHSPATVALLIITSIRQTPYLLGKNTMYILQFTYQTFHTSVSLDSMGNIP